MVEYVVDDPDELGGDGHYQVDLLLPGDDALHGGVVNDALHGVGLAAGGLAVGEYCPIVSRENICGRE